MPSFGDGHAHPLLGGLEAVGPPIRPCRSVAEIVEAVREIAETHPDEEWIVGASYDGSLAPNSLFDARWLDAVVPDRPVMLRAWDYHTAWCNSAALERAGIAADTPDRCSARSRIGRTDRCWARYGNGAQSISWRQSCRTATRTSGSRRWARPPITTSRGG